MSHLCHRPLSRLVRTTDHLQIFAATGVGRPRGRPTLWVSKHKRGVPPFGHSTQLRVFVDPDLLQYDEVWAAAGTWNDNFGAAPADIVRVAGGVVTDLKR